MVNGLDEVIDLHTSAIQMTIQPNEQHFEWREKEKRKKTSTRLIVEHAPFLFTSWHSIFKSFSVDDLSLTIYH